jgi:hypothetical protein
MEKVARRNRDFLDSNFPGLSHLIGEPIAPNTFIYKPHPVGNISTGGKAVHSRKDPIGEARNLIRDIPARQGVILLFLGLGLGYHVEQLKGRLAERGIKNTIIIVERSAEIFTLLCNNRDVSFLKNSHLFVGDALNDVKAFVQQMAAHDFEGYRIVRLRGSHSLHDAYYELVEQHFKESMAGKLSDLLTRYAFEALWMRNTIDNVPALVGKKSISCLKGALRGKPAIVVNAGPSLLNQLQALHGIQHRVHLIAVDTALTPLLKGDIVPDFVVTLDAGFHNALDFNYLFTHGLEHGNMALVADVVTNPIILSHWKGPLYFSETSLETPGSEIYDSPVTPLFNLLHDCFPPVDTLASGGSISTTALELSLLLEAEPIYTTALDLSYTDYKTHVNSSSHYDNMYSSSNRLRTIESSMLEAINGRELMNLPSIHRGEVLSDYVFSQYAGWIEKQQALAKRITNCTERGAALKGLSHIPLESLAHADILPERKDPVRPRAGAKLTRGEAERFLARVKQATEHAREALQGDRGFSLLRDPVNVFYTILIEAEKLYPDQASLSRYLSLFFTFMCSHVQRASARLIRHDIESA